MSLNFKLPVLPYHPYSEFKQSCDDYSTITATMANIYAMENKKDTAHPYCLAVTWKLTKVGDVETMGIKREAAESKSTDETPSKKLKKPKD
jgi:hypothetical protein